MHKSARIQTALLNNRIFASLLDILSLVISSLVIYFIMLYTLFACFGYVGMKRDAKAIEVEYNLDLGANEDFEVYEAAIQDIYFNKYPDEMVKYYKEQYGDTYSITHIYNIVILRLPSNPTYDNYKSDYYQYVQKADGTFDVDTLAIPVEGYGDYYERNLQSLFYSGYKRMDELVEEFNPEYLELNTTMYAYEVYSRIIGFVISFIVLFVVIPYKTKECQTIFMKKFDLAYVDNKTGYFLKKRKIVWRYLICFILPFVGFMFATKYSIIILGIGYLLLDHLLMLFNKNNINISDKILAIETCKLSESLLFDDKKAETLYFESEEGKKVMDTSFLEKLQAAEEINIISDETETD